MDASKRRDLLLKLANLMEHEMDYLVELEALDNGKPMNSTEQPPMSVCASSITSTMPAGPTRFTVKGNTLCYTRQEAVGICVYIIPWNL